MHQRNQENECCLVCKQDIYRDTCIRTLFVKQEKICFSCSDKLIDVFIKQKIEEIEVRYLYLYNDFFRKLLYQYKGLYDIALKDLFLLKHQKYIRKKYKGYTIVPTPSFDLENKTRGFSPVEEIVRTLKMPIFLGLYKKKAYKQALQSYSKRKEILNIIGIQQQEQLNNKKILLIDDVMTSGYTIKACIMQLQTVKYQDLKIIIIAKNNRKENYK